MSKHIGQFPGRYKTGTLTTALQELGLVIGMEWLGGLCMLRQGGHLGVLNILPGEQIKPAAAVCVLLCKC